MRDAWILLPSTSRRRRGLYSRAVSFANPDRSVLPGLFVRVRVPALEKKDALLVPGDAVSFDQQGEFSWSSTTRTSSSAGASRPDLRLAAAGDWRGSQTRGSGHRRGPPASDSGSDGEAAASRENSSLEHKCSERSKRVPE